MLKGRAVDAGPAPVAGAMAATTALASPAVGPRPTKKLSFREPEIMGYAGAKKVGPLGNLAGVIKDFVSLGPSAPLPTPGLDSTPGLGRLKMPGRNNNGRILRQVELSGSCEDLDLESQAMRIVRTVGQAFEVCHKLSLNSSPTAGDHHADEEYEDRETTIGGEEEEAEAERGADGKDEKEGVEKGGREEGEGAAGGVEGGRAGGEGGGGDGEVSAAEAAASSAGAEAAASGPDRTRTSGGRESTPEALSAGAAEEEEGEEEATQALDALLLLDASSSSPSAAAPPSSPPHHSHHLPPSPSSPSSNALRPPPHSSSLDPLQSANNPGKRSPVGCGGESFGSQLESVGRSPGGGTSALHHELQMLRERAEQQAQQTRAAVAQVRLLRDQLAAETAARIEAQARTHQLLVHNRELLEHIEALVMHLQEVEAKQAASGSNHHPHQQHLHRPPQNVTLMPQLTSSAKVFRWFELHPLSRPESGFVDGEGATTTRDDAAIYDDATESLITEKIGGSSRGGGGKRKRRKLGLGRLGRVTTF